MDPNLRIKELEQKISVLEAVLKNQESAGTINRVLFEIADAVNTTRDLDELYAGIHRSLKQLMDLPNFYIAMVDPGGETISFPYFVDETEPDVGKIQNALEPGSLTEDVLAGKKPLFLDSGALRERVKAGRLLGVPPKVWIGIPLVIGSDVLGVMAVQSYTSDKDFSHRDMELLTFVSGQISFAIERKIAETSVLRLSNQTEQLSLAAAAMMSIQEKQEVFDRISKAIVEYSDYSRVLISLFKEDHPYRDIIGFGGVDAGTIDRLRTVPMSRGMYDDVFDRGNTIGRFSYYVPHTMKEILNQEATVYGEGAGHSSTGRWHPHDNLFVRMNDQNGECIGIISVDNSKSGKVPSDETVRPLEIFASLISQIIILKREQEERRKIEEELQRVKRIESIGVLAGGIAHDFNNILTGLFGNISMALNELDREHPVHVLLSDAEVSLETAKALTGQLLTFARGGEPVKKNVSAETVVRRTTEFNLSGSTVSAAFETQPDLWPIHADPDQVSQVVSNLIINARQAMPDGGRIRISMENRVLGEPNPYRLTQGNYLEIRFADEGIGISKKHIERVFDPYFTTKNDGSGLGMAIVHSIVKKHSGHVGVRSEPGKGTTVTLWLPAAAEGPESCSEKDNTVPPPLTSPQKILVMDDDEIVRTVTERMLEKLGYAVTMTLDGQSCVEAYAAAKASGDPFDLVIMDLTIPGGMGGKDAVRGVLAIDPHARVIVSSGYSMDPVMANYRDFGFSGVASKPYKVNELSRELLRVMKG